MERFVWKVRVTRLTREGCVIAVRVRGCGGSVDERLRRRRRRPVLVGGRGVRVVRRMVAESSRTTQKQTAVTRHGRHVMVMVLVHSPAKIDSRVKRKETKRSETRRDETRRDETRRNEARRNETKRNNRREPMKVRGKGKEEKKRD